MSKVSTVFIISIRQDINIFFNLSIKIYKVFSLDNRVQLK